jgi:hypothetical protein
MNLMADIIDTVQGFPARDERADILTTRRAAVMLAERVGFALIARSLKAARQTLNWMG